MNGTVATIRRAVPSLGGNLALIGVVTALGLLYASGGGSSRDSLIATLLINVVLVLGFQVFIGNTGVLSFGHLGFAAIGAYTMALLSIPVEKKARSLKDAPWGIPDWGWSPAAATVVGLLVAVAVGALLGLIVARTSGLSATMITLAFVFIVEQLIQNRKAITGGQGLPGVPRIEGVTWPLAAAAVAVVVAVVFRHTTLGRLAVATREDELAAGAMGVRVFGPRFAAFVVSVGLVALGGMLSARNLGTISPRQFGFDLTIPVMAMLVVGGMRTVSGAIVGTAFITAGKEFARFLGDGPTWLGIDWPKLDGLPDVFLAGSLLVVLLTRPGGLLGDRDLGSLSVFRRLAPAARPTQAVHDVTPEAPSPSVAGLVIDNYGVTFGGFTALDSVDLSVAPGSIHGIIGPNGAGKTTLINLITGVVDATTGSATLGGVALVGAPHDRARAGVARTFQNLRLFWALSVHENIAVADLVAEKHRGDRVGVSVDELIALVGLTEFVDRSASELDYGNQRRLEIARAAALRPDFMLLDEPTSGMSETESMAMVAQVRSIAAAVGAGVLVIDHDLGFITTIADRITVLDQGAVIAEGTPAEVQAHPAVIAAYLGTAGSPPAT